MILKFLNFKLIHQTVHFPPRKAFVLIKFSRKTFLFSLRILWSIQQPPIRAMQTKERSVDRLYQTVRRTLKSRSTVQSFLFAVGNEITVDQAFLGMAPSSGQLVHSINIFDVLLISGKCSRVSMKIHCDVITTVG